jgi:hypothetical protein
MLRRIALTLILTVAASARAAVIYDEAMSGDFSNSGLTPTVLSVAGGSNQIFGSTGSVGGIDRDYWTFAIPDGLQLTSIVVLPGTVARGVVSFIGMQAGTQVTLPTNTSTATGLLGWYHYGVSDIDSDILGAMSVPSLGSSGFARPLGAGNLAFWVQDFNVGLSPYGFDFQLEPVPTPEPGTWFSSIAAILLAGICRRR